MKRKKNLQTEMVYEFRVNMFQCIVQVQRDDCMRSVSKRLHDKGVEHKLFSPGSLGKIVQDPVKYQIGSVSFKLKLDNDTIVSALVFSTNKIKVSGGLKHVCSTDLDNETIMKYLRNDVVSKVLEMVYKDGSNGKPSDPVSGRRQDGDSTSIKDIMITNENAHQVLDIGYEIVKPRFNAVMYRTEKIGKKEFIMFIDRLRVVFSREDIVMPDIMRTNGNRRGRICAVKVRHVSGKGVFAVDHSGTVQFFSYTCMEDLHKHCSELLGVWL